MSQHAHELQLENDRLNRELAELQARVRTIESSRWHRLNPRGLWRRHVRAHGSASAETRRDDSAAAAGVVSADSTLTRFREEVVARGAFTHEWFVGHISDWEPILSELERQSAHILEIGSFEGLSACYLIWRLPDASITCIDTFAGRYEEPGADVDPSELEARFDANVALVGAVRVRKLVADSRRALLDLAGDATRFDLIYVDGSHLGLDVIVDASLSWQLLKTGGTLVFDDYAWTELGEDALLRPGPAIDAFLALVEGKHEVLFADYQVAVRKLR